MSEEAERAAAVSAGVVPQQPGSSSAGSVAEAVHLLRRGDRHEMLR